ASRQKSRYEKGPEEHSVSSARRSRSGTSARASLGDASSELHRRYQSRQTVQSGGPALPWTSVTKLSRPDHVPERSLLTLGNIRRPAESSYRSALNSLAKCHQKGATLWARTTGHNSPGRYRVGRSEFSSSGESKDRARLWDAEDLQAEAYYVDQNNAVPLLEASRNRDVTLIVGIAIPFELSCG